MHPPTGHLPDDRIHPLEFFYFLVNIVIRRQSQFLAYDDRAPITYHGLLDAGVWFGRPAECPKLYRRQPKEYSL